MNEHDEFMSIKQQDPQLPSDKLKRLKTINLSSCSNC